jgi:hypothetical protein
MWKAYCVLVLVVVLDLPEAIKALQGIIEASSFSSLLSIAI